MLEQHQWITWSKLDSGQDAGLCPGAIYHIVTWFAFFVFHSSHLLNPSTFWMTRPKKFDLDTTGYTFFLLPGKT